MNVTEIEETVNRQNAELCAIESDLLEILAVVLLVDGSVYVLMGKIFQDEWQIICVEKELGKIFVFENIFESQ